MLPCCVGQHLELDVVGARDVALQDQALVAKGVLRLAAGGGERLGQLAGPPDHAHALAAAARGGLDQHRVADLGGLLGQQAGHRPAPW